MAQVRQGLGDGQVFGLGQPHPVAQVLAAGRLVPEEHLCRHLLLQRVRVGAIQRVPGALCRQQHHAFVLSQGLEVVRVLVAERRDAVGLPELVHRQHDGPPVDQLARAVEQVREHGRADQLVAQQRGRIEAHDPVAHVDQVGLAVEGPPQPLPAAPLAKARGGPVLVALAEHDGDPCDAAQLGGHTHLRGDGPTEALVLVRRQVALAVRVDQPAVQLDQERQVVGAAGQAPQRCGPGRGTRLQRQVGTAHGAHHRGQAKVLVDDDHTHVRAAQRQRADGTEQGGLARPGAADDEAVAQVLGGDRGRALDVEVERILGVGRRAQHDDRRTPPPLVNTSRDVVPR